VTGRDRIIVAVLAAVVTAGGFWFAVLSPKRAAVSAAEIALAEQQQRLDQAQADAAEAAVARRRYTGDYAAIARLGKAVPADDDIASLMWQLESVASGADVEFSSLRLGGGSGGRAPAQGAAEGQGSSAAPAAAGAASQAAAASLPPGATVGTAGLATLPFSFVFEGSFFDMQRFLARVDRFVRTEGDGILVSGRLLTIDGIALTSAREEFPKVKATMAATAYLAPDEGLSRPDSPSTDPSGSSSTGAAAASGTTAAPDTDTVAVPASAPASS
jgi:Tfp pilus assembly protein PilO